MEHISHIAASGQSVSYFRTAYINQRCLNNVSLKFFDSLRAPDGCKFGEIRGLEAGPEHYA
jgi:hypothetical protein